MIPGQADLAALRGPSPQRKAAHHFLNLLARAAARVVIYSKGMMPAE
jgi:hypothetical protein